MTSIAQGMSKKLEPPEITDAEAFDIAIALLSQLAERGILRRSGQQHRQIIERVVRRLETIFADHITRCCGHGPYLDGPSDLK